jgi:hypothetical protein
LPSSLCKFVEQFYPFFQRGRTILRNVTWRRLANKIIQNNSVGWNITTIVRLIKSVSHHLIIFQDLSKPTWLVSHTLFTFITNLFYLLNIYFIVLYFYFNCFPCDVKRVDCGCLWLLQEFLMVHCVGVCGDVLVTWTF